MWTSRFKGQILEKAEWQTTCVAKEQESHLFNVLGSPTSCPHPLFSCHGRRLQVNIVLSWPYLCIIHLGIVLGWRVFKQLHVRKCPLGYKIMKGRCTVLYKQGYINCIVCSDVYWWFWMKPMYIHIVYPIVNKDVLCVSGKFVEHVYLFRIIYSVLRCFRWLKIKNK